MLDQIKKDLLSARVAKNEPKKEILQVAVTALDYKRIALMRPLTEKEEEKLVTSERDKLVEASKIPNAPADYVADCLTKAAYLSAYLSEIPQLSDEELEVEIKKILDTLEKPLVMKTAMSAVMPTLGERADGKRISTVVKKFLS